MGLSDIAPSIIHVIRNKYLSTFLFSFFFFVHAYKPSGYIMSLVYNTRYVFIRMRTQRRIFSLNVVL